MCSPIHHAHTHSNNCIILYTWIQEAVRMPPVLIQTTEITKLLASKWKDYVFFFKSLVSSPISTSSWVHETLGGVSQAHSQQERTVGVAMKSQSIPVDTATSSFTRAVFSASPRQVAPGHQARKWAAANKPFPALFRLIQSTSATS